MNWFRKLFRKSPHGGIEDTLGLEPSAYNGCGSANLSAGTNNDITPSTTLVIGLITEKQIETWDNESPAVNKEE